MWAPVGNVRIYPLALGGQGTPYKGPARSRSIRRTFKIRKTAWPAMIR